MPNMAYHKQISSTQKYLEVWHHHYLAGLLSETEGENHWFFQYDENYPLDGVSLSMPTHKKTYEWHGRFPPFFENLLPEGLRLEILCKKHKLDASDHFAQLEIVGVDTIGAVSLKKVEP